MKGSLCWNHCRKPFILSNGNTLQLYIIKKDINVVKANLKEKFKKFNLKPSVEREEKFFTAIKYSRSC